MSYNKKMNLCIGLLLGSSDGLPGSEKGSRDTNTPHIGQ